MNLEKHSMLLMLANKTEIENYCHLVILFKNNKINVSIKNRFTIESVTIAIEFFFLYELD